MKVFYEIPDSVFGLGLNASELLILIILVKLKSDYSGGFKKKRELFVATNDEIVRLARLSPSTVKRAKLRLRYKGFIDYFVRHMWEKNKTWYRIALERKDQQ